MQYINIIHLIIITNNIKINRICRTYSLRHLCYLVWFDTYVVCCAYSVYCVYCVYCVYSDYYAYSDYSVYSVYSAKFAY